MVKGPESGILIDKNCKLSFGYLFITALVRIILFCLLSYYGRKSGLWTSIARAFSILRFVLNLSMKFFIFVRRSPVIFSDTNLADEFHQTVLIGKKCYYNCALLARYCEFLSFFPE